MRWKYIPMVVCWAVLLAICCSCGTGKSLRRAEQCYSLGEYFEAARYYKAAYQRTSPRKRAERGALAFRMAECYRRINYTARAKGAYLNALRYGCKDSVALFYLAATLQKNGEYKAAADPASNCDNGERGCINVIDLANRFSCSFIQTDDMGRILPDGSFTVEGRRSNSPLRADRK